jgi:ribonuclease G
LPWFRRKRKSDKKDEAAAVIAAVEEASQPAEPVEAETPGAEAQAAEGAEAVKRRRRRGSRGGRSRKKATPAEPVVAAAEPEPSRRPEKARPERGDKRTRSAPRRRQQQRRSPLPAAKRELLISVDIGEQRVAVLEDDRVAEVYLERPERRSIAGNIYLGVVDNVLPGMEAAFVEIGLEKNGFLYVDEIVGPELEGKRHGKKIQDLISRGEQLLVQAVKDPMKTKGARLTTEISLPGRFLVYVPNGEGLGVSRRLDDAERTRLKEIIKKLKVKEGGVIVRTAADGASAEDVERDLVFLQRLWKTIQARAKTATAPELVYQEAELPLRIVRDLFAGDFVAAQIDHERTYRRIVGYLKKTSPHMLERVHRYKEKTPLFEEHGVDKEIASTLSRRVDLPSGGYLVFDYAEAFTVIDVNTGRFVGSRSRNTTQRLEDTITKNNLEAVKEVVRQLRLRDIGGIIVIDFIDMANPKNRAQVEEALRGELERDRTKTYVVEISPLGLVEMTRQNVTDGPREILTRKCPLCEGDGIVVSEHTTALEVERRLRTLAGSGSRVQAYRIALHPRVLSLVAGPGGSRLAAIEEAARRRFFLVPAEGHVHVDHFEVLAEGKLDDLRPEAPVSEGDEVEVKLLEVGLHDAAAGVGRLDGIEVLVADAAQLVGKKAKTVIGRVLDGQVLATLADEHETVEPITFESEAEKPTRAPSRRKAELDPTAEAELAPTAESELEPTAESELEPTAEIEPAEPEVADVEPTAAEGAPAAGEEKPKRKSRRGSRGGRKRKKKVEAPGGDVEPAPEESVEPEQEAVEAPAEEPEPIERSGPSRPRRRTPRIHVPATDREDAVGAQSSNGDVPQETASEEPEAGADGEEPKPKRKTRRGTRGGRGRRKTAPTAAAGGKAETVAVEPGEADYVPMSEWLDDFK